MSDTHCLCYPISSDADSKIVVWYVSPQVCEETIFPRQIDRGLHFPYFPDLVEMCFHYGILPTQLSPNSTRTWVDFRVLCQLRV